MKCPVCSGVDLVMSERQGIEIDYCPKCRGVWLDRGELDKIIERSDQDRPAVHPAQQAAAPVPAPAPVQPPVQPAPYPPQYRKRDDDDSDRYYPVNDPRQNPGYPSHPSQRPQGPFDDGRHYGKPHKKKSFWSEIFD